MDKSNAKLTGGSDRALDGLLKETLAHTPPAATECPPAETMAAYFERSLEPGERQRVELHLASCAECREMLTAMDCAASATNTASDAPIRSPRSNWAWLWDWRWLAPATAVLALAGIWFVRQRDAAHIAEIYPPLPLVAQSRPYEAPIGPAALGAEPAPKAMAPQAQQSSPLSGAIAQEKEEAPAAKKSAPTEAQSQLQAPEEKGLRETEADQLKQSPMRKSDNGPAGAQQAISPGAAAPVPPAPANAGGNPAADSAIVAGAAPAAVPQYEAQQSTAESNSTPRRMLAPVMAARAAPKLQISSPDPKTLWRVSGDETVEHSTDGGATWQQQPVKTGAAILSGSAPSATVCWLAGRAGVVLLTTDGTIWSTVSAPVKADIAMITAQDAFNATVQTTDGRKFSTTDAGKTWTPQP